MSDRITDIVLVGGGLAAAKAAETIRQRGFDGNVTLIGDEPHAPYQRPPLSKGVLVGNESPEATRVHPDDFWPECDIELITDDAVTAIDRESGTVTTTSGATRRFDRLLLATGARPRQLPLSARDLDGILTLRTLDDAQRLGEELQAAAHVTIVGAGWIGCEVAAAARTLGCQVTMVDPLDTPLQRVLGGEVGNVFAQLHRDHGVELRMGVGVSGAAGGDRVGQLTLSDKTTIDTDLVVVGIGVIPRTELAAQAGLAVDDGIVIDANLATGDPRILAAGDVANAWHPHYQQHVRVEHWANALKQGTTAGANLLGAAQVYDQLPYFYTDQYDLGMEYVGHATDWDDVVIRGDPHRREFIAFWISKGRVVAAMNLNVWDVVEDLKTLIRSHTTIDPARLANPDVSLSMLAPTRL